MLCTWIHRTECIASSDFGEYRGGFTMKDFLDGIFSVFYGLFGFPLAIIFIIIVVAAVIQIRKRRRRKREDWYGQSPVEKFDENDKGKNK